MTAAAKPTFGATFKMAVSGQTLVTIAELTSIPPPSLTRGAVDVTSHDSPSGAMEYIGDGVFDVGEIPLEGHLILNSTSDTMFTTALVTGGVYDCEISGRSASGTGKRTGKAIVTAYEPGAFGITGKQTFTATLKPTGVWANS